jgi:lipid biosynthesis B12-binding/radical SAM protein
MKVLLIASNITSTPYAVYPLGMSIIANTLTKAGHTVKQFDFLQHDKSFDAIKESIDSFKPELIGISIRNIDNVNILREQRYLQLVKDIVTFIRTSYDGKIILGGSGFSLIPEAILEFTQADYGIAGEGEEAIIQFMDQIKDKNYPKEKIITKQSVLSNSKTDIINRCDISGALYSQEIVDFYKQHGDMAPIQTKRGCTNHCVYCSYPVLEGSSIRNRPAKEIVADINCITKELGVKTIFFTDSVFNDESGYFREILKEMKKENVTAPWTAFIQPQYITEADVALMKETGMKAAEIGADAACDITLKAMGKGFDFNAVRECCDMFVKQDISSASYYMFGGPGETKDTVLEGIDNILSLKQVVSFIFMGIRILPKTPLEKIAIKDKILTPENNLLESVYYISPQIEQAWLEQTLTDAFKGVRHCIFPPDAL